MKIAFLISTLFLSSASFAASIDPVDFPWFNGPTRDAIYRMSEHSNSVHIFEAFTLSCSWCNRNAPQVQAMADEYADNDRVQFIDLGLDTDDRNITRWVSTHNPTYPVVKDVNRTVYNALRQSNGVPQTFVVDCRGEMVGSTIGYWGAEEKAAIREAIATALATDCSTPNP
jgi:hypothetical protein